MEDGKGIGIFVSFLLVLTVLSNIAFADKAYYDPTYDIQANWDPVPAGTHYTTLDDGVRQPNVPNTADYIEDKAVSPEVDEHGINAVTETSINDVTLWVYVETGNRANVIIILKQNGTQISSRTIGPNTPAGWYSLTYMDPGTPGNLTAQFDMVASGGGKPGYGYVYAWYYEVDYTPAVDNTPPQIAFISPTPQNGSYNASQTINVEANDTFLTEIRINVNGSVVQTCGSSPCSYALENDGTFDFFATAYDSSGNTNSTETRSILIDKTAPTIEYAPPTPATGAYNSSKTINVTASDANLDEITITVNGAIVKTCTSSPCSYALSSDGTYEFNASAKDIVGNAASLPARTVVIDTIFPAISYIHPTPSNGTYNTSQTISVQASDANLDTISINVNGSVVKACSSSPCSYALDSNGTFVFYAYVNDTVGHVNTTETRNVTIQLTSGDNTPPSVQFEEPTPQNGTYNTSLTINVSASDDSGLDVISIIVDGVEVHNCTNTTYCNNYTLTADGTYTFYGSATDIYGNTNVTATRSVTIDRTLPSVQFVAPTPASGSYNASQTINVTATDANLDSIWIVVNGTIVKTCTSSPCTYSLTASGNYTFYAAANDTAGNINFTETRNAVLNITYSYSPWVATNKASYSNCGRVYYSVTTVNEVGANVDSELDMEIRDSLGVLRSDFNTTTGNGGTGVYLGSYDLASSAATGTWSVKAITCGAIGIKYFQVG